MNNLEYRLFYRRNLPHFQPPGATLFVTFRLAGSIPAHVVRALVAEAKEIENKAMYLSNRREHMYREQKRLWGKWDQALDQATTGPFWLRDSQIASLVTGSLHYLDSRVYDLGTYTVMPNHVHVVFTPLPKDGDEYHSLSSIMHSLKGYTAGRANRLLGRTGAFWQHESYDHVVRNEAELERIVAYVINNPVKAGLVEKWEDWEWTYCKF